MRALILVTDTTSPHDLDRLLTDVESGRRVFIVPTNMDLPYTIEQMPQNLRKEMEEAKYIELGEAV